MSAPLKLGIIGCGGIATSHLAALEFVPDLTLHATCDIDESRARAYAEQFGAEKTFTDYEQLASDPDLDAVSICLPHHLHRSPTVACAAAGKHVLCEKPMETSLADADAMIAAAEQAGVVLMVGQVLRFREANLLARKLLAEGAIGTPMNVLRRRFGLQKDYSRAPWSADPQIAGGWVLYGYGAHEVDQIIWLLDSPPKQVFAMGQQSNPHWQDYDEITIQLRLCNGAIATQQHSLNCPFPAWECIVLGTEGAMRIETGAVVLNDERLEAPLQDGGGMREQLCEFAAAIAAAREPEASGRSVRPTMVALEAARQSLATGAVVEAGAM